jgi:hypothetical protein
MRGDRFLHIAIFLLLWGTAATLRPLAGEARVFAALAALTLLPGWWIAGRLRPGSPLRVRAPLAFGVSHGVIALSALFLHLAGLPLRALYAPLFLLGGWSAAMPPPPPPEERKRAHGWMLALLALLLVLSAHPRDGFWTDAYDHIGTARFQAALGDPLPGEYFHAGREGLLDPRKGTNHTVFALSSLLTGVDPGEGYSAFWAFHVALLVFAVFWLAESVEWLGTAGYPGKAGLLLYFPAIALAVENCRRKRRARGLLLAALLGAAAAGVHAFAAILGWLGIGALAAGLLSVRRLRAEGVETAAFLGANIAGALPFLLFRRLAMYPPSNPLHLQPGGALLLSENFAIIDPIMLAQALGLAGLVSFLLLPFVTPASRGFGVGEMFLVSASVLLVLLVLNPFLFPWIDGKLGYLTRRLPLLIPSGFVLAAVVRRGWEGRYRVRAVGPAILAAAAVAVTVGSPAARLDPPRTATVKTTDSASAWMGPLRTAARAVPAGATVLTDPVTGYALFGMARIHPVAVLDQHSSPNDPDAAVRLAESQRFLWGGISDGSADRILDKYDVDYLLINELFPSDFRTFNAYVRLRTFRERRANLDARPERFEKLGAPEGLHLYRVVGTAAAPEPDPPRRARPTGGPERSEEVRGFLLLGGRCREERLHPGQGAWIVTGWEAPGSDAGALPLELRVRGRRGGDWAPERMAIRRDPALRPWAAHPLGEPGYPYILWRAGDVVTDSVFVRVPIGCPPGAYELQVLLDECRFFPLRRLSGLERGAVRSGWTPIDTLEVLP